MRYVKLRFYIQNSVAFVLYGFRGQENGEYNMMNQGLPLVVHKPDAPLDTIGCAVEPTRSPSVAIRRVRSLRKGEFIPCASQHVRYPLWRLAMSKR